MLKERYRSIGHQFAKIDPLNLKNEGLVGAVSRKVLELDAFEFTEPEKNLKFPIKTSHAEDAEFKKFSLQEYKDYFEQVYCGAVGYEFTHLLDKAERDFMKRQIEEKI